MPSIVAHIAGETGRSITNAGCTRRCDARRIACASAYLRQRVAAHGEGRARGGRQVVCAAGARQAETGANGCAHTVQGRHDAPLKGRRVEQLPKVGRRPLLFLPFLGCIPPLPVMMPASLHTRNTRQMRAGIEFAALPQSLHACASSCSTRLVARCTAGVNAPGSADECHCNLCELFMTDESSLKFRNLQTKTRR